MNVRPDLFTVQGGKAVTIPRDDIMDMSQAEQSTMPTGLLDTYTREEILDLMAYLLSKGNPDDPMFVK